MIGLTYLQFLQSSEAKPSCSISELSREIWGGVQMKKLMPIIASLVAMILAAGANYTWF